MQFKAEHQETIDILQSEIKRLETLAKGEEETKAEGYQSRLTKLQSRIAELKSDIAVIEYQTR
jgi:uncharacterized small protein (DUF1192 family)